MKVESFERGTAKNLLRVILDTEIARGCPAVTIDPKQPISDLANTILTGEGQQLVALLKVHRSIDWIYVIGAQTISVELAKLRSKGIVMHFVRTKAAQVKTPAQGAIT